jgi:anti-sigma factor RsiW
MNDAIRMQISAFVDGELPQNEAELLLRRLCQDGSLRQEAAEYLAMGRAIRGERSVAGMANLRGRISAALDDTTFQEEPDVVSSVRPRFLRPLAGVAIAATVALAALLGLQQASVGPEAESLAGNTAVAERSDDGAYTVPNQVDDPLRDYYLRHSASSSYFGANSINARLVTLQLREDVVVDSISSDLPDEDARENTPESAITDTP